MMYLNCANSQEWPRLVIEEEEGKMTLTVWEDGNTEGYKFVASNQHDLDLLINLVRTVKIKYTATSIH